MSSKKITYSSDFKLKVLDYYFRQGGDDKFGLKKKTALHFNIDKKTINRMLNNPEMVKRARKLLATRKSTSSTKVSPSKTPVKKPAPTSNKVSNKSVSSSQSSASSNTSSNSSSNRNSTSSTSSTKPVTNASSKQQVTSNASKTSPQKQKPAVQEDAGSPGVEVFDLPEDPDYSLLKCSINAAAHGVGGLAKLLVTGTEEVRNVLLNECDVILECKVCRGLFRSVVNFLAHKRIYCQDEFADVRSLFHKGDVQGVTSQSNTIVVEPEPPPDRENINPTTYVPAQGRTKHSGIDSIALKLARKRKAYHAASSLSSSTNTGSSSYYRSIEEVRRCRDKVSRDCSVMLEDIGGVKNAVFQSFVPPGAESPNTPMSSLVEEASHSKSGITVAINQNGDIVKTASGDVTSMEVDQPSVSSDSRDLICLLCNTRFATQKTLSVHQRSQHGFERCIYACPICQASFLSMWAVVKHLQRTHKKTKSQVERLRKVVRKNVRKKIIYKEDKDKGSSEVVKDTNDPEVNEEEEEEVEQVEEEEEEEEVEDSSDVPDNSKEVQAPKKIEVNVPAIKSPVKETAHKNDERESVKMASSDHHCVQCNRKISSPYAMESHSKSCSLMQVVPPCSPISPLLRSEIPGKKIGIQIRKDYQKSAISSDKRTSSPVVPRQTRKTFKVPKAMQEKDNQPRIEEMMNEFCDLSNLKCTPCGRHYQTVGALKRHASSHMGWTRYQCSLCDYRHYQRYEIISHCVTEHNVRHNTAESLVIEAEFIGQLKYFLDNEDVSSVSSDVEQDQPKEPDSCAARPVHEDNTKGNQTAANIDKSCLLKKELHVCNTRPKGTTLVGHQAEESDQRDEIAEENRCLPMEKEKFQNNNDNPQMIQVCESSKGQEDDLHSKEEKNRPELVSSSGILNNTSSNEDIQCSSDGLTHTLQAETSEHPSKVTNISQEVTVESITGKDKITSKMDYSISKANSDIKTVLSNDPRTQKNISLQSPEDHQGLDVKKCGPVSEITVESNLQDAQKSYINIDSGENLPLSLDDSTKKKLLGPDIINTEVACDRRAEFHKRLEENAEKELHIQSKQNVEEKQPEKTKDEMDRTLGPSKKKESYLESPVAVKEAQVINTSKEALGRSTFKESDTLLVEKEMQESVPVEKEKQESITVEKEKQEYVTVEEDKQESITVEKEKQEYVTVEKEKQESVTVEEKQKSILHAEEVVETISNDSKMQGTFTSREELQEPSRDETEISKFFCDVEKEISSEIMEKEMVSVEETSGEITKMQKTVSVEEASTEITEMRGIVCVEKAIINEEVVKRKDKEENNADKVDDSDSISSCIETSEQESVTEASGDNDGCHSVSADCTEDEELSLESESVDYLNTFREEAKTSVDVKRQHWDVRDESHDAKDDLKQTFENTHFELFGTDKDIKPPNFSIPLQIEKEVRSIPKDDLSLEVKDFIGFPSTKDEKNDRPTRVKRSFEQKDFIYEMKKKPQMTENEDSDDHALVDDKCSLKVEGVRSSIRRRSSSKSDLVAKKPKTEGEYNIDSCNGSNTSCNDTEKSSHQVSSVRSPSVDDSLSLDCGEASSFESRRVRLVRRRHDASPHTGVTTHLDSGKMKGMESYKGKHSEKVSEVQSFKSVSKKESPTLVRCSSRLKTGSSPISKQERKDLMRKRSLTNGQGQSNSVITTSKHKS